MWDVGSEDTSQAESSVLANQEPSTYFQGPRCRSSSFLQSSTKYKLKLKYNISIVKKRCLGTYFTRQTRFENKNLHNQRSKTTKIYIQTTHLIITTTKISILRLTHINSIKNINLNYTAQLALNLICFISYNNS